MAKRSIRFGIIIMMVAFFLCFISCSNNTTDGSFVAVANISNLPVIALVGNPLTLSGTVVPVNATNKSITWSGSGVSNGVFTAPSSGQYSLTATILNGASESSSYIKNFTITAVDDNSSIYIATAQGSWTRTVGGVTLTFVITNATWTFSHPVYGDFGRGIIIEATANRYQSQTIEELHNDGVTWLPRYSYETGTYNLDTGVTPNTLEIIPDPQYINPGNYSAGIWTKL